jgi:hypothetical protein
MPPPSTEDVIKAERAIFAIKLAEAIAKAEERAIQLHGDYETSENKNEWMRIINAPAFELIAKDGAPLRFFFSHLTPEEWGLIRSAVDNEDKDATRVLIQKYEEFRDQFDLWVSDWVAQQDPEIVTALSDAIDATPEPDYETIKTITRTLVEMLEKALREADEH